MDTTATELDVAIRVLQSVKLTLVNAHSHCERDHPECHCADIIATALDKINNTLPIVGA